MPRKPKTWKPDPLYLAVAQNNPQLMDWPQKDSYDGPVNLPQDTRAFVLTHLNAINALCRAEQAEEGILHWLAANTVPREDADLYTDLAYAVSHIACYDIAVHHCAEDRRVFWPIKEES